MRKITKEQAEKQLRKIAERAARLDAMKSRLCEELGRLMERAHRSGLDEISGFDIGETELDDLLA